MFASAARAIVIGQTIADSLFSGMDPVGQTVRVMNLPFRVVGVMARKGQDPQGRDQDDTALRRLLPCRRNYSATTVCRSRTSPQSRRTRLIQLRLRSCLASSRHWKYGNARLADTCFDDGHCWLTAFLGCCRNLFWLLPGAEAAALDPIEALRYE